MASAIAPDTEQFSVPYLTIGEFKSAPTAIDVDNLVVGGNQAMQDAELTNAITRASSWIDQYCNQILGATQDTEQQRGRIKSDGTIRFHPKYNPIIALLSFSYGTDPNSLVAATDPSKAWLEEGEVIFPYASLTASYSNQGPLQFGMPSTPGREVFLRYSYVNGYTNSTIASATAATNSFTVTNATGIVAGQSLKIYDGLYSENVTVGSSYTFGSMTVPIVSSLLYSHNAGVAISAMPAAIKQAAILATTAFLKVRGDNSLVMDISTRGSEAGAAAKNISSDLGLAQELLKPFRRIR
jgi:hypothetical protein